MVGLPADLATRIQTHRAYDKLPSHRPDFAESPPMGVRIERLPDLPGSERGGAHRGTGVPRHPQEVNADG